MEKAEEALVGVFYNKETQIISFSPPASEVGRIKLRLDRLSS